MNEAQQISDYIRVSAPAYKDADHLESWVEWNIGNGFLATIKREDGQILGLVVARTIAEMKDGQAPYEFDPEGTIIWVDLCIAEHALALQGCVAIMRRRFGLRGDLAFERGERPVRVYKCDKFHRKMFRKTR